ncbi:MAG: CoA ester lyase [Sulfuricaulis sp.]|uniref:CoA ester lyase n=1 Tax=Sulfuricaulis sp. TaxID=2003553 RepID=UPI0034A3C226
MAARSYLFAPGERPERFQKAYDAGADAVILDLEDGVALDNKVKARSEVVTWLSAERPVYVRINGPETEWFNDDLKAVGRQPGVRGIVLPKAESAEHVARVAAQTSGHVAIIPFIETAQGLWHAIDIARSPRVERLAFGSYDFQLDTGIQGSGEELLYASSQIVIVSRVAGILPPIDTVTIEMDDADKLKADIDRARRLGFGAKLCIHPKQVAPVNAGFSPSAQETAWAKEVLAAVAAAGKGAIRFQGRMIDRPIIERAKRILE